jgi:Cu/Ag efflux protein CusF
MRAILTVFVVVLFVVACSGGESTSSQEPGEPAASESVGEQQRFEGKGVVEAIDMEVGQVTLTHEDIEGFMNAMTMDFEVQNTAMLEELEEGMQVSFTVVVEADGTYFIDRIEP